MDARADHPRGEWTEADDRMLDRLVDGELDGAARRALLARLEATPGGWRRCALAFLEAQCWRESLADGAAPAFHVETPPVPPLAPEAAPRRASVSWGTLAAAAGLLGLAFTLGWRAGAGAPRPIEVAVRSPAEAVSPPLHPDPKVEERVAVEAVDHGEPSPAAIDRDTTPAVSPRLAYLPIGPGGDELPVLVGAEVDPSVLANPAPAIPERVRARWERLGYRLDERREVVSMPAPDGGQIAVPVDRVRVEYVGLPPA